MKYQICNYYENISIIKTTTEIKASNEFNNSYLREPHMLNNSRKIVEIAAKQSCAAYNRYRNR